MTAEGWYRDPFGLHAERWISDGAATDLVRDNGVESQDEPPEGDFAEPLVPAAEDESVYGADLVRADDAASRQYSGSDGVVAALNTGGGFGIGFS